MLIPKFSITQNDEFIIILIKLPYVKIGNVEFYVDRNNFKLFLHPYLLDINFPENLLPMEEEGIHSGSYDYNTCNFFKLIRRTHSKD